MVVRLVLKNTVLLALSRCFLVCCGLSRGVCGTQAAVALLVSAKHCGSNALAERGSGAAFGHALRERIVRAGKHRSALPPPPAGVLRTTLRTGRHVVKYGIVWYLMYTYDGVFFFWHSLPCPKCGPFVYGRRAPAYHKQTTRRVDAIDATNNSSQRKDYLIREGGTLYAATLAGASTSTSTPESFS